MKPFLLWLEDYKWLKFEELPKHYQEAIKHTLSIHNFDINGNPTALYRDYASMLYRIERIPTYRVLSVFRRWGWATSLAELKSQLKKNPHLKGEITRVKKILRLKRWPYIVTWSDADTFDEWAKSSENHGDGWHRAIAAGERGELYMDFVFMKNMFEDHWWRNTTGEDIFSNQSFSSNDGPEFSVKQLFDFAKQTTKLTLMPVQSLADTEFSGNQHASDEPDDSPEFTERAMRSDLSFPILVGKEGNEFHVIDGRHRLFKAMKENIKYIKAYVIDMENLPKDAIIQK